MGHSLNTLVWTSFAISSWNWSIVVFKAYHTVLRIRWKDYRISFGISIALTMLIHHFVGWFFWINWVFLVEQSGWLIVLARYLLNACIGDGLLIVLTFFWIGVATDWLLRCFKNLLVFKEWKLIKFFSLTVWFRTMRREKRFFYWFA